MTGEAIGTGEVVDWHALRRIDFLHHLFAFLFVTSILFLVDWRRGDAFWVQWVALAWGSILFWHLEQLREWELGARRTA